MPKVDKDPCNRIVRTPNTCMTVRDDDGLKNILINRSRNIPTAHLRVIVFHEIDLAVG